MSRSIRVTGLGAVVTGLVLCALRATPALGQVYDAGPAFAAHENDPAVEALSTFGNFSVGYSPTLGGFTPFSPAEHRDATGTLEGFFGLNNVSVPGAGVNRGAVPSGNLAPNQILLHPGNPGPNGFADPASNAVLRFTVTVPGAYHVVGDWQSLDTGGTLNEVLLDGAPQFSSAADNSTFDFTTGVLAPGQTIDFIVNSAGDITSDSTGLRATLTATPVPEPAAAGAVMVALTACALARRRPTVRQAVH